MRARRGWHVTRMVGEEGSAARPRRARHRGLLVRHTASPPGRVRLRVRFAHAVSGTAQPSGSRLQTLASCSMAAWLIRASEHASSTTRIARAGVIPAGRPTFVPRLSSWTYCLRAANCSYCRSVGLPRLTLAFSALTSSIAALIRRIIYWSDSSRAAHRSVLMSAIRLWMRIVMSFL